MRNFVFASIIGAFMAALPALGASAATINLVGNPGPLAINGATYSETFNFGFAGNGTLEIDLIGRLTVDGNNTYQDNFEIELNGGQLLLATFNLGGGGLNVILNGPSGTTFISTGPVGNVISRTGGTATIVIPIAFAAGVNTLDFSYTPVGPANGGGQPISDENWGYSGTVTSAVPEPATWAMMLIGFAGLGYAARRRREAAAA